MTDQALLEITQQYGTPAYLFDIDHLRERILQIREILSFEIKICFSIKANPFLIPAMVTLTDSLEVCSPGELTICKKLSVPPSKIIYSGVNKTKVDVEEAIDYEVAICTAESLLHVALINEIGCKKGKVVPLLLRLNAGSQFGMSEEDLLSVVEKKDSYRGIEIVGVHYFAGTQRKKIEQQQEELEKLHHLYEKIEDEYGLKLKKLEYGPGLGVPYFEGEDFSDTLKPIKDLLPALQNSARWCDLTIEMGRFFSAECGHYLTTVMDQKSNLGVHYSILDGGIHQLNYFGQMMGMKIPIIRHLKRTEREDSPSQKYWTLCGSLCTTADVQVRKIAFEDLKIDDVLSFENTGAYSVTEGVLFFLSRTMPRILLQENGVCQLVRDFIESSEFNTIKNNKI